MAQILGDAYSKIILVSTHSKSKTAIEISEKQGVPIAACYRRIKRLESMGLIRKEERLLTQKGKRIWSYLSNINNFEIYFKDGKLMAKCELRSGYVNQFHGDDELGTIEV